MRCLGMLSAVICCAMAAIVSAGERPVLLITPQGVYESKVVNGVPGSWVAVSADVIVQGFNNVPNPPGDGPKPPVEVDKVIEQIQTVSKMVLKSTDEAVAVGTLLNSLQKLNLKPDEFKQALVMAAPIVDEALQTGGRINQWAKQSLAITTDVVKLKAGLLMAFEIPPGTFGSIQAALDNPSAPATEEAFNFLKIIEIIKLILDLLKNLGIGGGQ